ncbi:ENTPD1, partial [Symbiodinium pilosum]
VLLFSLALGANISEVNITEPSNLGYHGIIIDAGSSGSRVWVFAWPVLKCDFNAPFPVAIPSVVASQTVHRGLATLGTAKLNETLQELLSFAEGVLIDREDDWSEFPVYLFATAGFRRMRPDQREGMLQNVRAILADSSFYSEPDHVRILSGEEEGAYGWLAVNAEKGLLEEASKGSLGVLDLGGASMQITFVPEDDRSVLQHSFPVHLQGRQSNLYSASYLQFGLREAQRLLQRQLIARALVAETTSILEHPCMPRGSNISELLIGDESGSDSGNSSTLGASPLRATWYGKGLYEDCADKIAELFDKSAPCYLPHCTFNGRYQPTLGSRRFLAFSAFSWVVDALGLPAEATALEDIETAARYVCKMDWTMLHERWQRLDEQALQSLCFSATYVVVLLHHGLGFDKKSHQILFTQAQDRGNISWARGAIIWEVNNRFSRHQPLCKMDFPEISSSFADKGMCQRK